MAEALSADDRIPGSPIGDVANRLVRFMGNQAHRRACHPYRVRRSCLASGTGNGHLGDSYHCIARHQGRQFVFDGCFRFPAG